MKRATLNSIQTLVLAFGIGSCVLLLPALTDSATSWQAIQGGRWRFSEDAAKLTNPANRSEGNGNIALFNAAVEEQFKLTTSAKVAPTSSNWDDFSIIFGFEDKNNYYYVSFNENNNKKTNGIFQMRNGVAKQLLNIKKTIQADAIYQIQVRYTGKRIKVRRNGSLVASLALTDLPVGQVGVGSRNDAAQFSHFELSNASLSTIKLTNWKLTLPIGAVEDPTVVKPPELKNYQSNPYFINDPNGLRFRAPTHGVTTQGSEYPRSELREMTNGGTQEASWSSTGPEHSMYIKQAITALPHTKDQIIAGQIHDGNNYVIAVRLQDRQLLVKANSLSPVVLDDNYELGSSFTVKFVAGEGQIKLYYNDAAEPAYTLPLVASGLYFKAGAYTQSNCVTETVVACGEDNYGEVKIEQLIVK